MIQIQLIASDHHKMKLLEYFHPELKVLNIHFFPYCIKEWNKLDNRIREAESIGKLESMLLTFIKVKSCSVFFYT